MNLSSPLKLTASRIEMSSAFYILLRYVPETSWFSSQPRTPLNSTSGRLHQLFLRKDWLPKKHYTTCVLQPET